MTETPSPHQDLDADALRIPATPPAELARIAAQRPDLHPAIAAHPSCYPDLATWIAAQGDAPQPLSANSQHPAQPGPTTPPQRDRASAAPQQPQRSGTSPQQSASQSVPQQQKTPPDVPSGIRRRSVVKTLSVGIGITAVGALGGAGAWWATHRNVTTGNSASFSMSALDGGFLQGLSEIWSIPGQSSSMSPDGGNVSMMRSKSEHDRESEILVYPISADNLGSPVVFSGEKIGFDGMPQSVTCSWWGDCPLIQDNIYDTSSSHIVPVPWDTTNNTFLGAPDKDTAILIEAPHPYERDSFAHPQGAIICVDRQGHELWRTAENYTNGFLDPAHPDLLIGYRDKDPGSSSATPHILDTKTGATRAELPSTTFASPDAEERNGGLLLASDGLVLFSNDRHNVTAEAYSFDGESAWSLTGGFAEIVFCGVPSLNVVNQALTRQDGSTALIAENGTALVQAADRALSREGAGTPIELSRYDAGEARLDNFSYFTVLADGSGLLAANNIDDANIRMFNTSTGTQEWGMSGYLAHSPWNQGIGMLPSSYQGKIKTGLDDSAVSGPSKTLLVISLDSQRTTTCFRPAS
ncbi:hypothetical protein [Actinomyces israelii]|mgnify:FL=1|uniref:variant leucine-rich repeat-containing protein n=1 Tax=Actinomyces israelii TaxID=1659 RepID=UPI002357619F|nr:hypothetical protein [Actinomyces israelii]